MFEAFTFIGCRYSGDQLVVGIDLRNELRGAHGKYPRCQVLSLNRPHLSWENGSMIKPKLSDFSPQLGRWEREERLGDGCQEGRRPRPGGT